MRPFRRFRRIEQLEMRILMAADTGIVEIGVGAHGVGCPCPACSDCQLGTGHYVGDGHDHSDDIRFDDHGNAYFFDPIPADVDPNDIHLPMAADGGGEQANLTVPIYHSNPDAEKKIFLDFDGHTVTNTSWNFNNDGNTIHAPAYSVDDDIFGFTAEELDRIFNVWERVSEDYSPFEVDVTTEDPGPQFFKDGRQGIRVLISTNIDDSRLGGTDNEWFAPSGGVGYIDSWNWRSDTPVWVFSNLLGGGVKKVSEAAAHEVGHSLGLSHDGLLSHDEMPAGTSYFEGQGNWAPIMGNAYHRGVSQWSRGEYDHANNTENDLAIITSKIDYRADDHNDNPNEFSDPTPLTIDDYSLSAKGIIERADDVDAFSFTVGPFAGEVSLSFEPWHNSPNLNIRARLHASSGAILFENNPTDALGASIQTVLEPGDYFLAVAGVGEGDPASDGYSQYASLGQYTINGMIESFHGDINNDVTLDSRDIDSLRLAILAGSDDPVHDLNDDGVVNSLDVDELVYNIFETNYGDANLDGFVDVSDFNIWNTHKFQPGFGWSVGDFNGDFKVDTSDFNLWSANRFTAGPPTEALAIVVDRVAKPFVRREVGMPRAALSQGIVALSDGGAFISSAHAISGHPVRTDPSTLVTLEGADRITEASDEGTVPRAPLRRWRLQATRRVAGSEQVDARPIESLVDTVFDGDDWQRIDER